jgi:molybdate transport system permease protein
MNLRQVTIGAALAVFGFYACLILSLAWFLDAAALRDAFLSNRVLFSVKLSLGAALLSSSLALILAVPAGYALSRFRFPGREATETILEFPIIVSPAALGAILLIFFNNPLGVWIQENAIRFVFTMSGIVLAQFATILGIAVRLMKTAFDEVPVELETVARTLGATPRHTFLTVTLPLARRGLGAAFILAFAKALGEFGATIMIAGTMAQRTETLPVAIFLRLASAEIEGTVALIVILIAFGLVSLFVARRLLGGGRHA